MTSKQKYYAYIVPQKAKRGVTSNWIVCEALVRGEPNARFRGFKSKEEAENWLSAGAHYSIRKAMERGIYFDAGTGRGRGVEISVTDEKGSNLLAAILPQGSINEFGKYLLASGKSNNYGELLACKYALEIALAQGRKKVFGDSKLVIQYWSKGYIKKEELPYETFTLAFEVVALRNLFASAGGSIEHISGEENPADLGFHK